jgi:hypothetical protein
MFVVNIAESAMRCVAADRPIPNAKHGRWQHQNLYDRKFRAPCHRGRSHNSTLQLEECTSRRDNIDLCYQLGHAVRLNRYIQGALSRV